VDSRSGPPPRALTQRGPVTDSRASPRIAPAALRWADDQPFATRWGDIYHAPDGATEVARVFLQPSGFADRVGARREAVGPFRVGELGFGTGLNFIVAAEAARDLGCALTFVSFEAEPIAPADFATLAARRAADHPLYRELAACYPPLVRGWHQRHLANGRVKLSVFWGDVATGIAELEALQRAPLDAWFLDGFAPDRNPEMWTDPLFATLARRSAVGTTVATFTAAGRVRRGLEAAGFTMRRVDQRPHKRESLAGVFAAEGAPRTFAPRRAVVAGAGLAGASAARHLAESGMAVTVFDPAPPAGASATAVQAAASVAGPGSRIPTTVLHGRLLPDTATAGMLRCHAFLYAAAWAARFPGFARTGVLQLAGTQDPSGGIDPAERLAAIAALWDGGAGWLDWLSPEESRVRCAWPAASGGLWFRDGGVVATPQLCAALLDHPGIEVIPRAYLESNGALAEETPLVLACGPRVRDWSSAEYLETRPIEGQLDFVAMDAPPRVPLVGNGYLVPGADTVAAGSTYEYRAWAPEAATAANLQQLAGRAYSWQARARGVRTVSSDRTAIAGPLIDTTHVSPALLYASTGHGSMGNVTSHFAGALISAQITGDLPPMSPALVAALAPLRFRERQARRSKRAP
jgi:tRNA 5-methylaminomethyl-2-thiouridine biosynthesis bifunctional protein